jgi:hypothetical protein
VPRGPSPLAPAAGETNHQPAYGSVADMSTTCGGLSKVGLVGELRTRLTLVESNVEQMRRRFRSLPADHPDRGALLRQLEAAAAVASELESTAELDRPGGRVRRMRWSNRRDVTRAGRVQFSNAPYPRWLRGHGGPVRPAYWTLSALGGPSGIVRCRARPSGGNRASVRVPGTGKSARGFRTMAVTALSLPCSPVLS